MNKSKISKYYKKSSKKFTSIWRVLKNIPNNQILESNTEVCHQQSYSSLKSIRDEVAGYSGFGNESSETVNSSTSNLSIISEIGTSGVAPLKTLFQRNIEAATYNKTQRTKKHWPLWRIQYIFETPRGIF